MIRPWLRRRNLLLVAGPALMVCAVACGGDETEQEAAPPATTLATNQSGAGGESSAGSAVRSDIAGFRLENLTIALGDTVTWINQDNAPHTVSHGVSPSVDGAPLFRSGTFTKDGTFTHTFDTAGTFAYFCEVHPSMVGSITVK